MEGVELSVLFAAPEPCKFVNFFLDFYVLLRCDVVKYAHGFVENLLNKHKERPVLLVMCVGFDELFDVDGLADLDELLDGFVLGLDDWKYMAARKIHSKVLRIAYLLCGVMQGSALWALPNWCHAVAWLLRIVEDVAPIARR